MAQFRISNNEGNYELHLPYEYKKIPFGKELIKSSKVYDIQEETLNEIIEAGRIGNKQRINEILGGLQ